MTAEREALKLGIEYLTVLFPTEVSSFVFQVESTDRTVQYKLNAQSLRLFGLHRDVNDAHRACANRLQNKQKRQLESGSGSGSTVGSEVRPLEEDQAVRSQDRRKEWPLGSTIYFCHDEWSSKVGSRTTNNEVTKDSRRQKCRISSMTCTRWYSTHSKKYVDWEQTRTKQGTWPATFLVSVWFCNDANLPTRIGLLDVIRAELKNGLYKQKGQVVSSRLELSPKKETIGEGPCFILQRTRGGERGQVQDSRWVEFKSASL